MELDSNGYIEERRPEAETHIYRHLMYDHRDNSKQGERAVFSVNGVGTTEYPYKEKEKKGNGPLPHTLCTKINSSGLLVSL